jgi:hypothetical protein
LPSALENFAAKGVLMLKIQRAANREAVFTLIGRMDVENVGELKALFASEPKGHRILMDLKDLTLADREAVKFLGRCEADSIETTNCPAYISRVDHQRAALTTTIVVAACSALTVGKETLIS